MTPEQKKRMQYNPQPPKLPGYAPGNINPDKLRTPEQNIEQLSGRMDQSENFLGMKFLGSPTTNFASPFDAFYTRAGSLPSYLMTIGVFSVGPNGTAVQDGFQWTDNSPGAGAVAWSAGVVTYIGVQYAINAGSAAAGNQYIYWQLSNPNVFQSSVGVPVLGVDDFIIGINQVGTRRAAFNFTDAAGERSVITSGSVFIVNSAAQIVALMNAPNPALGGKVSVLSATGVPTADMNGNTQAVSVYSAAGAQQIFLDGTTGRITFPASGAPAAGKTLAGYIPVVSANGTNYYLAVYT